jgi:rhamnulokinase
MLRGARFVAIDVGASSGRVMVADAAAGSVELREVHRFANRPVRADGTLYWDVLALWSGVLDGLRLVARDGEPVCSIGIDTWAIDYGLLDADGRLLANPVHYRDPRTDGVADIVLEAIPVGELYAATGVQVLPFNTIFQWVAARESWAMRHATHALLIPDLFGYWLTGSLGTELTNASTTGLLDTTSQAWAGALFDQLGLRAELFAPLLRPGDPLGPVRRDVAAETGIGEVPVTAVGSHDTASAVVAAPARDARFAYISCGTWSLVGVELDHPVTSAAACAANFSNELGVDGTVRFLRNVMGLWLLQECVRTWERDGVAVDLPQVLADAAQLPGDRSVVDPDRPEFLPPGDMPSRLRDECRRTDQPVPESRPEIARCVLDSLAAAHQRAVRLASELSGVPVDTVHLVGGGAQNALLCQLTADACGVPVVAGPVEAAAYGNVLVQARAAGVVTGGIADLRAALLRDTGTVTYHPR